MKHWNIKKIGKNTLLMAIVLAAAVFVCLQLSKLNDDNNPFAVSIFILAVAVIARFTEGYVFGIVSAAIGVICVNYMFTKPFFEFNFSITGYPLTFTMMILVSIIISTLTTQIKNQEKLKYEAEKEKMRSNLLRSVSHDLRTPLTSILGASSVMMENENMAPDERSDLIKEINKDAKWLIRITENILSVTRSSGNMTLKKDDELIEEIISTSIIKFRKNYGDFPINVKMPDDLMLISADATLIEQVLLNLFENAVIHGKTADKIDLIITREPGKVVFAVEDNGAGIPHDELKKVFDAYFTRGETSSGNGRRSMGIGLSVCQSIIRAHGGDIFAYNNSQGGAGIYFWLPMKEDADE
ncbi:MAG: DUF4118 domain-containing protein [Clostridia bacterium]|nr:DUF4118 domain-containing protein [Clostridia bacterium]